jgi:REP element-mobilizing transposase RayT
VDWTPALYELFPKWIRKIENFSLDCSGPSGIPENSSMSFYRRNLPHFQRDYKPHFVTFATKHRMALSPCDKDIVLRCCIFGHATRYTLYVALVMPDHVHLIFTPMTDKHRRRIYPLHEILMGIKGYSARLINEQRGIRRSVWQEESFDHVLRSSESLDAKIAYVLANPVRRGLVYMPEQYPWKWTRPRELWGSLAM